MGSLFSTSYITDPTTYATEVKEDETQNLRTYDYVIVGGGTAACVLAHRLTEDPTISVLVIEAGKSNTNELFSRIPASFAKNFRSRIDWGYSTTNQDHAESRSLYWPAGKVIGGSSSINAMMYQRPCEDDIREWTKHGAKGWDWDNFKKYLIKAEKYTHLPEANEHASQHGFSGRWSTSLPGHCSVTNNFLEACQQIGISKIDDPSNRVGPIGASFAHGFIDQTGTRSSAATAYLTPTVLARPNLTVAVEATVTRIIFTKSSATPRATGVELATSAEAPRYRVAVRREVLCCAGSIKTPQILTVSGIGPKTELERLGVPVVKELEAVGRNLYDHLVTTVAFRSKQDTTTLNPLTTPIGGILPLVRWLVTGGGPLATLCGQAWAFVKSTDNSLPFDSPAKDADYKPVDVAAGPSSPDLEYIFAPVAYRRHGFMPAPPGTNTCTIGTVLLRPQSSGTITLKTASIWDGAKIDPNVFAVESDLETFMRGVRLSLKMARSEHLNNQLLLPGDAQESEDFFWPGDADPEKITDEALKRYIRQTCETIYHPMCTARMGRSPEDSVVDHELRVHGVSNLRVIDASVIPTPFAGHTCATVIGIAEKAADLLKNAS